MFGVHSSGCCMDQHQIIRQHALVHAMHHQEDSQGQMSDAEGLTTAFTAAVFFRGNLASARWMLKQHH